MFAKSKRKDFMFCKTSNEYATHPTAKPMVICLALMLALFAVPAFSQVGHIHQLYYNNASWADTDLTALTGGGIASPYGAIAAFYTTPNDQLHVYYVDNNSQHVHQLYYNKKSRSDADLTAFTGARSLWPSNSLRSSFRMCPPHSCPPWLA
jgi:hypothetical protein